MEKHYQKSFLQSFEWEEFQKILGRQTWRVQSFLIVRHDLLLGQHYLYCPRPDLGQDAALFFQEAKVLGKHERSVFLRVDLGAPISFPDASFSARPLQPQQTILVDLSQDEERTLSSFREKTRYNIRLASRKGVCVRKAESDEFKKFWELLQETADRDNFYTHPREYYEKLLFIRTPQFSNELFFADYKGATVAAALINFYAPSNTITYLHGASSRGSKEVMAPHLLHWRIMEEAKRGGFETYDLWGIDERRWRGVTRFKKGFGGNEVSYPRAVDIGYRNFMYACYRGVNFFRKRQ